MRLFLVRHAKAAPGEPDDRLGFDATAGTLREVVSGRGERVVAVAHQPNCSEIVLALTGRDVSFAPGDVRELSL